MKYVALLRGVNVGGKSLVKMADLKVAVEKAGFKNVQTMIQSGNILLESDEDAAKIETVLEDILKETFKIESKAIVKTREQLKQIVAEVPPDWNTRDDIRRYIAFTKNPLTAHDLMKEIHPKEGIDFLKVGDGVVYMTTVLSGLTKSGVQKIIGQPVYKEISLRNYSTVKKLAGLTSG